MGVTYNSWLEVGEQSSNQDLSCTVSAKVV